MSTTHTPGPWKVAKGDNGPKTNKLVQPDRLGDQMLVCDCENAYLPPTEQEANARLIAAAPDLLAALAALMPMDDNDSPLLKAYATEFQQARKTIAKALK